MILIKKLHFLSVLILGISSSIWAVSAKDVRMPIAWLILLSLLVLTNNPKEFRFFIKRFVQIGITLIFISLLQIIFRRQGHVIISVNQFPLVYSEGLTEAGLLWIRYMILFVLANIFAQVSLFQFLLFMNKIGFSLRISLLFLTTLKLIPFIFTEAKRALWFLRFRGIHINKLSLRNKFFVLKKLLYPLLIKGVYYTSYSALALEMRGFGVININRIPQKYPLLSIDYCFSGIIILLNCFGLFW